MLILKAINKSVAQILFCIIFVLLHALSLFAHEKGRMVAFDSDTTAIVRSKIYYPVNKIEIYEDYMSNSEELEYIKLHLANSPRIDSITIYSYASPEGRYEFNKWLAEERGKTAKRYILEHIPEYKHIPDSIVRIAPTAENWEGLREEVVENYLLDDKQEVLAILDMDGLSDEQRKTKLKGLNKGKSWRYILKNLMPHLRYATWISVWEPVVKEEVQKPQIEILPVEKFTVKTPDLMVPKLQNPQLLPISIKDTKTILALKTNLLYDALTWFNYSVEVPFYGDKFSALFYHQFPWWTWGQNDNEYCIRFLSIGGEGRWWFKPQPRPETEKRKKRDRLVGHFAGIYCESGKYDFEHKKDICYQGEFWSVGVSYGYSMPISRYLNLEFSISAGYASIAYRGYTPSPDYSILWRDYDKVGRWHYFGLTKAQISLVIPISITVKKGEFLWH